jgi:hypothetical protein
MGSTLLLMILQMYIPASCSFLMSTQQNTEILCKILSFFEGVETHLDLGEEFSR